MRLMNAIMIPLSKLLALVALSLLMIFLFTGNSSLSFHILGTAFCQSLRKLLLGAFLAYPLTSRLYLSLENQADQTSLIAIIYTWVFGVATAFLAGLILYVTVETPIGDFLRLIVSSIVRSVNSSR